MKLYFSSKKENNTLDTKILNNMIQSKEIIALIKKDLLLEWRQRYAINGVLLHVVSMIFVVFLSLKIMNAPTWNAIYWLVLLFSSVSAVAKSFIGESKGQLIYLYGIASPQSIILSKLIYNMVLMVLLIAVSLITYTIVMGNFAQNGLFYVLCILMGGIGFALTFTLISAISSKAANAGSLMPILSFPVIVPIILVAIKASKKAMDGLDTDLIYPDLLVLLSLNMLLFGLAYILFPYLWKD